MCCESPDALLPGLEGCLSNGFPATPCVSPSRDKLCRLAQLCPGCTPGSEHALPKSQKKSKPLTGCNSVWQRGDMSRVLNSCEFPGGDWLCLRPTFAPSLGGLLPISELGGSTVAVCCSACGEGGRCGVMWGPAGRSRGMGGVYTLKGL